MESKELPATQTCNLTPETTFERLDKTKQSSNHNPLDPGDKLQDSDKGKNGFKATNQAVTDYLSKYDRTKQVSTKYESPSNHYLQKYNDRSKTSETTKVHIKVQNSIPAQNVPSVGPAKVHVQVQPSAAATK